MPFDPLGLVLAGGRSSRMGVDKGLIREIQDGGDTPTWTEIALGKLSRVCNDVAVSIRSDQYEAYHYLFPETRLIEDTVDAPGPMGALLSAFAQEGRDLLVQAADMIFLEEAVLLRLIDERRDGDEAVLFRGERGLEPLCGIYTRVGLAKLASAVKENQTDGYSLQQLPRLLNVRELPIQTEDAASFRNVNSPDDLGALD